MTNIGASESKRARSSVDNRKRHNWVRPDKLEVPSNINSPVLNPPTLVVLDTPNFIRATPSTILTASHIQAGKSTATMHYRIQEGEDVDAYVRFHFWWTNSGSKPVSLANITSRFVINGFWEANASCSYIAPNWNYVYLDSVAQLNIIEFWNLPSTSLPVEDHQFADVAFLEIEGGLCETNPDETDKREYVLNKSYDLKHSSSFGVPPKGVVLFEVLLDTATHIFGADTNLAIANCSMVCPFVQFEVRDAIQHGPPI
jgi:hypothetical protein